MGNLWCSSWLSAIFFTTISYGLLSISSLSGGYIEGENGIFIGCHKSAARYKKNKADIADLTFFLLVS